MSRVRKSAGAAADEATSERDAPTTSKASLESVRARAVALTLALASADGCLPGGAVGRAQIVIANARSRTSLVGGHTVVALAGATGSGKSSLFNQLIGADVAKVGARRPTTSKPSAAIWGDESASALLDWLEVGARHTLGERTSGATVFTPTQGHELDGLVLLDLPDFDSDEKAHRLEADRLLDLVDLFVWVTDPQKYADARLHEDYIARRSAHEAATIVVLNQADRLSPEMLAACRGDLQRLLGADGVVDAEVIVTSAKDGSGVIDLRHRISGVVAGQHAAVVRLDSDLRSAAAALRRGVADSEPTLDGHWDANVVDSLTRAAGIPVILDAVQLDYRRATWQRTGWLFTRWAGALRPSPLKRLGLNTDAVAGSGGISGTDIRSVLGRSSLPPPTPAARSAVDLATRKLGERAGDGLPQAWADAVADVATPQGEDLADALDQAVLHTALRARNPMWWNVFGAAQWALAVAAFAGLIWLGVLEVLGWLQVEVDAPGVGELAFPFLLLAGGLLSGVLLSMLTRALGRVGARRRRVLVAARLRDSVTQVARASLVAPVQSVLDRHRVTREQLEAALKRV